RLRRRIDDLVDRLHGEVEGHELDDRLQARHRRAHRDAGKAMLGHRRMAGSAAFSCFAGAGAALERSAALAPSARMVAIGVLTATSAVPSGISILPSVPSSVASTSIVALSVSISAMTSPDLIGSPSFFSHFERLPFSIVGDRAGISTWIGMVAPEIHSLACFGCAHSQHKTVPALRNACPGRFSDKHRYKVRTARVRGR